MRDEYSLFYFFFSPSGILPCVSLSRWLRGCAFPQPAADGRACAGHASVAVGRGEIIFRNTKKKPKHIKHGRLQTAPRCGWLRGASPRSAWGTAVSPRLAPSRCRGRPRVPPGAWPGLGGGRTPAVLGHPSRGGAGVRQARRCLPGGAAVPCAASGAGQGALAAGSCGGLGRGASERGRLAAAGGEGGRRPLSSACRGLCGARPGAERRWWRRRSAAPGDPPRHADPAAPAACRGE